MCSTDARQAFIFFLLFNPFVVFASLIWFIFPGSLICSSFLKSGLVEFYSKNDIEKNNNKKTKKNNGVINL